MGRRPLIRGTVGADAVGSGGGFGKLGAVVAGGLENAFLAGDSESE